MKLGRIQSKTDARTLHLSDYLAALPAPPARELLDSTSTWPMLANDKFNCCTSAAAGHMVHHWTAIHGDPIILTDDDIIRAHATLTCDHLLECATMLDALKLWRNTGIGDHRIHSFVRATPQNADHLRQMVLLFGAAYLGLNLPEFACGPDPLTWPTTPWVIPPNATPEQCAPQSENGHCVTAIGYSEDGVYVVSWGQLKVMSWEFYSRFNFESYAILSSDWVERNAKCPSGFFFDALLRDLRSLDEKTPVLRQLAAKRP
ncbi:MAG: hypothetical protein WBY53_20380 [Acidobacteriaceae bacterium]